MRKEITLGSVPPRKVLAAMARIVRQEGGVQYHLDAASERARIMRAVSAEADPGQGHTDRALSILTDVLTRTRKLHEHV